ncbi:MAG: hypothetical protein R3C61_24575 [Bacteroidia bacterium]
MKILKYTAIIAGIILGLVLLTGMIAGFVLHEKKPEGKICAEAGEIANQIMEAVDCAAWDTTGAITWSYGGRGHHLWDKNRNFNRATWGDNEVLVDLNTLKGVAFQKGKRVEGKKADKLVHQAWLRWVNDAFWLNPLCKLYDPGTVRSLVKVKDGRTGLMITYQTGGATPGDSYVWLTDDTGMPAEWKLWVKILPVGGIPFTWEGWETLVTGAKVSTIHKGQAGVTLKIEDLKASIHLEELTNGADPFLPLEALPSD